MPRRIPSLWRYTRAAAILLGVAIGISAFVWIPISLALTLWLGGSAFSALHLDGRTDALVAHGRWTPVPPAVFYTLLTSELMAMASALTLFACLLVMWLADRYGDA
jgi:hypothetical protein